MSKRLLSTALVAILATAGFASTAQAASTGTINFSGKVLADTCAVNVNGNPSTTVTLPTVMTGAFTAAGTTAGTTPFTVALSGCDNNTTSAQMSFTAGSSIDTTTGYLKNQASGGSNVQIRLLDSSDQVINASTQANAPTISVTSGAGSTTLKAQYISTAASTSAGLVASTVAFSLTYQ